MTRPLLLAACGLMSGPGALPAIAQTAPADSVYRNAYVYTVDGAGTVASAVAIDDGAFVYVGDETGVAPFIGPQTEVIDLAGRMVLPGLHDSHVHALFTADLDTCDLNGEARTLAELVPILKECLDRYRIPKGEWLSVDQWNPYGGNQTSPGLPTIRAALDAVSTDHPIVLFGADGHHSAYNSAALARALDADGAVVGLTGATLRSDFAAFAATIGVDEAGEPTGNVDEGARDLIPSPTMLHPDERAMRAVLPQVAAMLAADGITSIMDPLADDYVLSMYEEMAERGLLTFRATLALFRDPGEFVDPATGAFDPARAAADYGAIRARLETIPNLKADAVKVFVDGVLEGNIYAEQPTLPNAAVLEPYEQPITELDPATGEVTIKGYVETASDPCKAVNADPDAYDAAAAAAFRAEHGFGPAQCAISSGVLEAPAEDITAYVTAMDAAGFTVHLHAIGDRAVRTALDAIAAARQANGDSGLPHSLAHLQLVHPDDQRRIGEMGVPAVFTFAWAATDAGYELTVAPFIDRVAGPEDLHDPAHYYYRNAYPAKAIESFGGILVGGSDAPVDVRDPRPFVNIEQAVTRAGEDGQVLNPDQAIDIASAIAAYTVNGARALNQSGLTGSIAVGKRADMIVLDRNLIELAETGRAAEISETNVLLTLLDGAVVHDELTAD
jgi:predicted amidohydrolase YtcJ